MTSKLNDPKTAPKTYWSILNQFLYNKKIKLISLMIYFVNMYTNKQWKYTATIGI